MSKLRIILDTNIFISGLLSSVSKAQKVFDLTTENHILLISDQTFVEIYQT
jgi:uncharacterized protein